MYGVGIVVLGQSTQGNEEHRRRAALHSFGDALR